MELDRLRPMYGSIQNDGKFSRQLLLFGTAITIIIRLFFKVGETVCGGRGNSLASSSLCVGGNDEDPPKV